MRLTKSSSAFFWGFFSTPSSQALVPAGTKVIRLARVDDAIPAGALDLFVGGKLHRPDGLASRPDQATDDLR